MIICADGDFHEARSNGCPKKFWISRLDKSKAIPSLPTTNIPGWDLELATLNPSSMRVAAEHHQPVPF